MKAQELLAAFEALEPRLAQCLESQLAKISAQLDKSIELASEPRQMRCVYLGDDRFLSLTVLAGGAAISLFVGAVIGLGAPGFSDSWSVWQASRRIDSPAQMCRLIAREYGTSDCVVPDDQRELGLRVIAHEDRR